MRPPLSEPPNPNQKLVNTLSALCELRGWTSTLDQARYLFGPNH